MKKLLLSLSFIIILFQAHAQSALFTSDSPRCAGDTMHFTPNAPGESILMEVWDFGDGTVFTYLPPAVFPVFATHLYANSGNYQVTRTVKFNSGTLNSNLFVQAVAHPAAGFSHPGVACSAQPVVFYDLSQTGGGGTLQSWSWNFGDPLSGINNTSALQNPSHAFTSGGTFTVTLTVVNSGGCTHSVAKQVPVKPAPLAYFTADTVYVGRATTFTDLSVSFSGSIVNWLWEFGDGSVSSQNNPVHMYATPATYMARLTVTDLNGCSHDTVKPVIVLAPGAAPPALQNIFNIMVGNGQSKCYNATQVITVAGNGTVFQVAPGGNATFIAGRSISLMPGTTVQPGGYAWGYIAPAGPYCAVPSMPATVSASDVIPGNTGRSLFSIYPNPTTGDFTLELTGKEPPDYATADLYGTYGEKLMSGVLNGELKHVYSLEGRPAGLYFIRVTSGSWSETVKIIKQ